MSGDIERPSEALFIVAWAMGAVAYGANIERDGARLKHEAKAAYAAFTAKIQELAKIPKASSKEQA